MSDSGTSTHKKMKRKYFKKEEVNDYCISRKKLRSAEWQICVGLKDICAGWKYTFALRRQFGIIVKIGILYCQVSINWCSDRHNEFAAYMKDEDLLGTEDIYSS